MYWLCNYVLANPKPYACLSWGLYSGPRQVDSVKKQTENHALANHIINSIQLMGCLYLLLILPFWHWLRFVDTLWEAGFVLGKVTTGLPLVDPSFLLSSYSSTATLPQSVRQSVCHDWSMMGTHHPPWQAIVGVNYAPCFISWLTCYSYFSMLTSILPNFHNCYGTWLPLI